MIFENKIAKEVYLSTLRKLTPEQKLKKACDLSDFTKKLFISGLRKRFPDLSEPEFKQELVRRLMKCSNSNF